MKKDEKPDFSRVRRVSLTFPRSMLMPPEFFDDFVTLARDLISTNLGIPAERIKYRNAPQFDIYCFVSENNQDDLAKILSFKLVYPLYRKDIEGVVEERRAQIIAEGKERARRERAEKASKKAE